MHAVVDAVRLNIVKLVAPHTSAIASVWYLSPAKIQTHMAIATKMELACRDKDVARATFCSMFLRISDVDFIFRAPRNNNALRVRLGHWLLLFLYVSHATRQLGL